MKPTPEQIINVVVEMRRFQREFFAHRDGLALRKAKELEKRLDAMLAEYNGTQQDKPDNKQLNLF